MEKSKPVQQEASPEEEELLQGKFSTNHRKDNPNEEIIKGEFDTLQNRPSIHDWHKLLQINAGNNTEVSDSHRPLQMKKESKTDMPDRHKLLQINEENNKGVSDSHGPLQMKKENKTDMPDRHKLLQINEENNTGSELPDDLKAGMENLSGLPMDDVKVHYNSDKPEQLGALAYTQGTDIYVASGQEKHLPHEVWHVAQQAQGRVQSTMQLKGVSVNDDMALEQEADMGDRVLQRKLDKSLQLKESSLENTEQVEGNAEHEQRIQPAQTSPIQMLKDGSGVDSDESEEQEEDEPLPSIEELERMIEEEEEEDDALILRLEREIQEEDEADDQFIRELEAEFTPKELEEINRQVQREMEPEIKETNKLLAMSDLAIKAAAPELQRAKEIEAQYEEINEEIQELVEQINQVSEILARPLVNYDEEELDAELQKLEDELALTAELEALEKQMESEDGQRTLQDISLQSDKEEVKVIESVPESGKNEEKFERQLNELGIGNKGRLDTILPMIIRLINFLPVSRSQKGATGVYFINQEVVKASKQAVNELFATLLARSIGLQTPATILIPTGKQDQFRDKLSSKPELKGQNLNGDLLFMEEADVSYFETNTEQLDEMMKAIEPQKFFKDLGKLFVFDTFINNADRMPNLKKKNKEYGNQRNLFVGNPSKSDGKKKQEVVAIDQEPAVPQDPEAHIEFLMQILSNQQETASSLVSELGNFGAMKKYIQSFNPEEISKYVEQGLAEGAAALRDLASRGEITGQYKYITDKYGGFSEELFEYLSKAEQSILGIIK